MDKASALRQEIEENIDRMTPFSDIMMKLIFADDGCAEFLVRTLMGDDTLKISRMEHQYEIPSLRSHSVTLDVYAESADGRVYNVEIQRDNDRADPHRARYHASLIDYSLLNKGEDYKNLPDVYVFFLTEHDYFKKKKQVYRYERVDIGDGGLLNDGMHIIYVNAEIKDDTALGRLMHDMCCSDPDKMNSGVIADRVRYIKTIREERNNMSRTIEQIMYDEREEGRVEGRVEGREEGREEERAALISKMIANGIFPEQIAELCGLPLEYVKSLEKTTAAD